MLWAAPAVPPRPVVMVVPRAPDAAKAPLPPVTAWLVLLAVVTVCAV